MTDFFTKFKTKIKLICLGFLVIIQISCGSEYYKKSFPLAFDPSKKVQNFEFVVEPDKNQTGSHSFRLVMYFKNADDRMYFQDNTGVVHTDDIKTNLNFKKMKVKAIFRDVANNAVIAQLDDYPSLSAHGVNDLLFIFPFSVKDMKKGKYILALEITNVEDFDYSKVERFEIVFTKPSTK